MLAIFSYTLIILLMSLNFNLSWSFWASWLFMLSFLFSIIFPAHNFLFNYTSTLLFMDYFSYVIILLTLWISSLMIMSSYKIYSTKDSPKTFISTTISLTMILVMCFSTTNIFLFYILFEASLIPTVLLILLWGAQPERLQASFYFMMYTIMASLPLLLSLIILFYNNFSMTMTNLMWTKPMFFYSMINYIWWFSILGAFLVKMPMFSTHLWLPKAHVEAPVAGSMVLAAILLKLGSYGMMRMTFIFPYLTMNFWLILTSISMLGAIITAMICLRQPDMKSLIAYSSVGHMGLLLSGLSSSSYWGMNGALAMTIAHGLSSSAMFSITNMIYEAAHTRSLFLIKGLITFSPILSLFFFFILAANMAAPPSINLLSEIILFTSILAMTKYMAPLIILTSFFTGCYSYILFTSTQHGSLSSYLLPMKIMNTRNMYILFMHLTPLVIIIFTPSLLMLI